MNTAKLRRFFSVFVRVHLWVVGLVLGIVLLLLAGLLFTPPGRSLLASLSLGIANRALPGTLELVELERLDFWEVSLRGVTVRDAKGEVVARAGHIRVELEPGELVHGRIVGERVTLEDVWVDLRTISESERGLVSAFVDAHAPPSPPSPSTGSPPYIRVDHISLRGGAARLPEWPQVGQLDVHELELEGSFLLDGEPSARVTSARFRAERAGQSLLWLDRLQADWTLASRPSSVALAAHTEGMQLEIEGKGVAPPAAGYQDAALEAHVGLRGATALECATLLQEPSLADAFRGEVGLDLRVEGTPRHARLTLRTETAGGRLQLAARADEFSRLSATLEPQGLRLSEIRNGLPAEPLSGRLEAKLDASSPEAMSWEVALGQGRLGEVQLPELSARGVLGANELRELDVRVTDGPSRVEAKGRVGFDGSMQLQADVRLLPATLRKGAGLAGVSGPVDGQVETRVELRREATGLLKARGSASLRSVVYQENRVGSADAQFDVQGVPPNLRGEVLVQAKDVQAGGQRLDEARVSARGGPSHYDVGVEAKSPEINGKGQLSVDVGRSDITVSGAIDGNYRGSPVRAEIDETVIGTANGSVRTAGISARLGDETLRLRGAVEPNRVDVAVQTDGAVELGRISKLLGIEPPLSGRARLDGRAHGTPALPFLEVKAVLDRVTWGERPPVDGDFELKLDAQKGQLSFSGEVLASDRGADGWRPLELVGKLDHRFRGGRGYEKRIARGRPDGHVEIRSLDLAFVEAWAGIKLPVSGHLGATLDAGGSWESPTLDLSLRSKLQVRGDPRIIDVDGELTLADERWVTHWALADQRGRWVALDAEAVTPRSAGRDEPLASRLAELPAQGKWSVRTKVEPRSLAELPLLRLLDDVPPALLSAELEIEHEANEEPRGKAHVTLAQSEKIAAMGACQGGDLRLDAELRFAQGQWELQLGGQHRGTALFQARSQGRLALAPALTGGAVELGPLQAEFEAEHLRLETLPFVCAHARGELDARIVVNDPLGVEPSGEAKLSVKGFRAAPLVAYEGQRADETLDIVLESKVDARHVEARGELVAGPRRSTLEGRMPLRIEKGRVTVADDAPLFARVRLEHLPISPLLDPKGSISYASGTVHGGVELNGTWSDPRFNGEISPEKVGFTATDLAQPLRDVQGKLRFSEREAHIENFVALDGDGRLLLDGSAHFEKLDHVQAAFHIRTEEFPLRQMGQVVAHLDFDAEVQTRVEPKETKVEIAIVEADMWIEDAKFRTGIPLDLHPDFVVDGQDADGHRVATPLAASTSATAQSASPSSPTSPAAPASAASPASPSPPATTDLPPPPTRTTLLRLESRERFWIKRSDFAVNLATHLDTVIEGDEANVKGDVLIERGYLTLLGKTFDFERGGKLTFIGGPTPDPVIDLTAVYDNRRTGDQVKVHITGRGSKPIIEFLLNDKKVEAGDAFGAIYGSQGTNQNAQSAPAQAAGFVGGLTAGLLATSARRELGAAAPIIMVEPGEKAGEGRVRAGFELDSLVPQFLRDVITGVYVEGIVARESANSRSSTTASQAGVRYGILLEFYYPKNFFSTAQYGPGSTWSLDLGWQL